MAANTLATLLARRLTLDEQNIVGNLLTAAGATLLSIAAIGESCQEAAKKASDNTKEPADTEDTEGTENGEDAEDHADDAGGGKTGNAAAEKPRSARTAGGAAEAEPRASGGRQKSGGAV